MGFGAGVAVRRELAGLRTVWEDSDGVDIVARTLLRASSRHFGDAAARSPQAGKGWRLAIRTRL